MSFTATATHASELMGLDCGKINGENVVVSIEQEDSILDNQQCQARIDTYLHSRILRSLEGNLQVNCDFKNKFAVVERMMMPNENEVGAPMTAYVIQANKQAKTATLDVIDLNRGTLSTKRCKAMR